MHKDLSIHPAFSWTQAKAAINPSFLLLPDSLATATSLHMGTQHRSPQTFRIWPTTDWSWQISTPTVQSVVPPGHMTSCDPSHDCQPVCIVSMQSWIAHRTLPNSEWYLPRSVWPNWPRRWCHHYIILETHPRILVLNDRSTFQWDDNRRRFKRSRLLVWDCGKMAFGQNLLFSLTLSHHAFSLLLSLPLFTMPSTSSHTHTHTLLHVISYTQGVGENAQYLPHNHGFDYYMVSTSHPLLSHSCYSHTQLLWKELKICYYNWQTGHLLMLTFQPDSWRVVWHTHVYYFRSVELKWGTHSSPLLRWHYTAYIQSQTSCVC